MMKQLITTVVFFCFAMAANAQRSQPVNMYKQKQLADSLRMLFPDLSTPQNDENLQPDTPMPVLSLSNKATVDGATMQGTIYTMTLDNMRILQPGKTNAAMPNAVREKTAAMLLGL